jgi:hypothetical protein
LELIPTTLLHKLLKAGELIDHSGVVPANFQDLNEDLFGIIFLMFSTIFKEETYLYLLLDMYWDGLVFPNLSMDMLV